MRPTFTIGIEEEYQTIDPVTRDLRSHIATEMLAQGKLRLHERVKAEMHQSVVEVGTRICTNDQGGARGSLRPAAADDSSGARERPGAGGRSLTSLCRLACAGDLSRCPLRKSGGGFAAGGAREPDFRSACPCGRRGSRGGDPHHEFDALFSAAYSGAFDEFALLARDEDGLKSYRAKVFDKFPRTNIPDSFSSYGEFEDFVNLLIKTNCLDNAKKIWWDIRPHPFFNTIEVRVCDIPMRAEETLAIAALIQATAAKLYLLHARNQDYRQYSRALIMENKWRAVRYGLDGKLIDFGKEMEVPERELILEYLEFVDEVVDELDCRPAIEYIRTILEMGTGADRQLRKYEETCDLKAVVDYMVEETQVGLF